MSSAYCIETHKYVREKVVEVVAVNRLIVKDKIMMAVYRNVDPSHEQVQDYVFLNDSRVKTSGT